MRLLRIVMFTLFITIYFTGHAFCFDLDLTVDDDIRKNYNSSKLVKDTKTEEESLPDLPHKLKNEALEKNIEHASKNNSYQKPPEKYLKTGNIKISKGKSFDVYSTVKISDWQRCGTRVSFKTKNPVYNRKYTIPASTVFSGEVIESHQPQVSCNGGLVVIRINSMSYKGQTVPIKGYVTRADGKNIFLNNIKGERTYLKTVWKKGSWGRVLFNRMLTLTVNLGSDGSTFILSPFPLLYGSLCFGANTLISPVTAFFSKGKHVSIPAGSLFRIKLLEDAYVD